MTKIANVYGEVDSLEDYNKKMYVDIEIQKLFQEASSYMYEVDLELMEEDFADPTRKLGTRTWETVFSSIPVGDESTPEPTPENIRCFVYGVALHALSDVYAHSAFTLQSGKWKRLKHNDNDFSKSCDNPNYFSKRWNAAQRAASSLMAKMYTGLDGNDLLEFTFFNDDPFGTFYLANLSAYAKKASPTQYKYVKKYLDNGDLWLNVLEKVMEEEEDEEKAVEKALAMIHFENKRPILKPESIN